MTLKDEKIIIKAHQIIAAEILKNYSEYDEEQLSYLEDAKFNLFLIITDLLGDNE